MCYDVSDNKLRRKLVKYLESLGVRIQYSVFVADLTDRQIKSVYEYVKGLNDEQDKCKFFICKSAEIYGENKFKQISASYMIL